MSVPYANKDLQLIHKDNIYLNIVMNGMNGVNTVATYDQTYTNTFLTGPEHYYCSVIRFVIPLNEVPIFHMGNYVDTTQNNPNITTLLVVIKTAAPSVAGTVYTSPLVWTPESNYPAPSPQPSAPYFLNDQKISNYYNVFSVQNVVDCFNTAIDAVMTLAGMTGVTRPYILWNPSTTLFSLVVAQDFLNTGYSLGLNSLAENYFDSFHFYEDVLNTDYYYWVLPTPKGQTAPFTYTEDYSSFPLWVDIRKIYITTTSLPVNQEVTPVQNPQTGGSISGFVVNQPIITDFALNFNNPSELKTVAIYNPTAQYRLIDMTASGPLRRVDLAIYWQDKYGNSFPIYISGNQQASVKLAFLKRHLYKHYSQ